MSKLSILDTTIRRRRTQNSINTRRIPASQVPPLKLDALAVQLPHVGRAQLRRGLVRLHLGPPRLARALNLLPDRRPAVGHEHALQQRRALELVLGRPVDDVVARGGEPLGGRLEGPRDRRRRPRHAVVPHDGEAQALGQLLRPPGDGQAARVGGHPRLGADDGAAVQRQVRQRAGQGPVDALHGLLAGHAGAAAQRGEAAEGGPQGEDSRARGGDAQGAANVGADADGAAAKGDEGGLAAG